MPPKNNKTRSQTTNTVQSARSAKQTDTDSKASQSQTADDGDLDNENSQAQTEPTSLASSDKPKKQRSFQDEYTKY